MNSKLFLFAIALLVFAGPVQAQIVESTWGTPTGIAPQEEITPELTSMQLEQTNINLGKIVKGNKYNYVIRFTNTGEADLILETVKPSCNCSTPFWSFEPVRPGEKGEIRVEYNTEEKSIGPAEGTITIVYNGIPNVEQVTFEAEILPQPAETKEPSPPHNE